jgi:hypothetical protein
LRKLGIAGAICTAAAALGLTLAPAAGAVDIIEAQNGTAADGWQAATCSTDAPPCSPQTPAQFFTQAAGHPGVGFTQFIVKHTAGLLGAETPVGNVHHLLVDLPTGLSVNPQATPKCQLAPGASPSTCPADTQVGTSTLTAALVVELIPGAPVGSSLTLPASPVYNLEPQNGQPARFGFSAAGNDVFLEPGVEWSGDYHEFFRIDVPRLSLPEIPGLKGVRVLKNRLVFEGNVGKGSAGGPFLTNPSTCFDPAAAAFQHTYSTFLHADSYEEEAPQFPLGSQALESPLPAGVKPSGCQNVPFTPGVATTPNTAQTDSPFGPKLSVTVPYDPNSTIAQSNLRIARVTAPKGVGLNPAAAPNLEACTDALFGKGTTRGVACPPKSEIGTVAIETPVLPPGSLTGKVFLGQQLSRDPLSGQEYRIFIDAESPRYGQSVRLLGNVSANPTTGQLTAVVNEAPQLPFTSVSVTFDAAKGVLSSPPICGPNVTTGLMTPWSGSADRPAADAGFTLTGAPGGKPCAKTLGERPFSPAFSAQPSAKQALAFTPFQLQISRTDGQQEIKGIDITLPPGATAKLAGVSYCPPQRLAVAGANSGAAEKKSHSCPNDSHVGVASVQAGTGASPLQIDGDVYLAGPYEGAPLSLAVVTPAVAGPFDLGTVVIRVPVFVDPETAQIHTVTTAIPDVFGGAKLDVRSIAVNLNRKEFTLNGTNCAQMATSGALKGGGSDPTNPAAFSSAPVSSGVQLTGCDQLKFRPKLKLRLFGATKRNKSPKLRAELKARPGDANIGRASVALPHALFLKQSSIAQICTRVQYAANQCPKKSVYGRARAFSPLLDKPLEGPVYLRSSNNTLPDMIAHLEGQIDIDLDGRIDSYKGGIRTTFDRVPDVPVTKFVLILPGGKHGLLVASRNLCAKAVKGIIQLKGQNGKKANRHVKLRTPCKGKRKGKGKHKGHKQGSQQHKKGAKHNSKSD